MYFVLLACVCMRGQAVPAHDADDFVIASLVVVDPGDVLYSVVGHACIRMQCPTYGLDYCFSYESEQVTHRVFSFLSGNLHMGLFAIPTDSFCAPYREEGRGVREYMFNLPLSVKQQLWRTLDEEMQKGSVQPYDYYHRGCARGCVHFLQTALGEDSIAYDSSLYTTPQSAHELWYQHSKCAPWSQFFVFSISGTAADSLLYGGKQLIIPATLASSWQHADYQGIPLLQKDVHTLVEGEPRYPETMVSPMCTAIILLILSLANLLWRKPYGDWMLLGMQTIAGSGMAYLLFVSDLCCTDWNWLIIPFNPLPAFFWHWRKQWALVFSGILIVWCILMAASILYGHMLCCRSHIVFTISLVPLFLKQSPFVYSKLRYISKKL